jgi:hypothetical protein
MSADKLEIKQKDFGCVLTGLVMSSTQTAKGGFVLAVAAGDTMYKVYAKTNGLAPLSPYSARMKGMTENGMFFEGERLS